MKKNIAVVMGGYSSEQEISIKSGTVVAKNLDPELFNSYAIHILKDRWLYMDGNEVAHDIDKHDFSVTVGGDKINFDFVFNVIHGTPGEDGTLLAYFDLLNIPYSSAPFYQMALTFNKRDCLSVAKNFNIATATSIYLNSGDVVETDRILEKVGLPCFVKPNKAGSSFGISKVHKKEALAAAIEKAFEEDSEILIESFLDGIEVSVGVVHYQQKTRVLPITEIVSENDFFDYEAKYLGKSKEITPARISEIQKENVSKAALHLYTSLQMSGFSRSEFILIGDLPFFLEMNTVPGMTEESLLPQQAACAGIPLQSLLTDTVLSKLKK
jgi:D-alanine-D-alanine ligase